MPASVLRAAVDLSDWAKGTDLPADVFEPVAKKPKGNIYGGGGFPSPPPPWETEEATHTVIDPKTPHPVAVEEDNPEGGMAVDWGDFLTTTTQSLISGLVGPGTVPVPGGQFVGPPVPPVVAAAAGAAGCPPRKTRTVTIDCATGLEVKRTRRRRRRLLTSGDLGDLAQLQALVGKGSNAMGVAVSKAIR